MGCSFLLGTAGLLGPEYENVCDSLLLRSVDAGEGLLPLRRKPCGSGRELCLGPNSDESACADQQETSRREW
jgi:hypothetical protein